MIFSIAIALFVALNLSTPAKEVSEPARLSTLFRAHSGLQDQDQDRGCCLWQTQPVSCTYTNRKYCSTKAQEFGVASQFFKDTNCEHVASCR